MTRTTDMRNLWHGKLGSLPRPSPAFAVTCLLLLVAFALGGSARGDVPAVIALRPIAIAALGFGLWRLRPAHLAAHRFLMMFAAVALAVPILHLVALPPSLWTNLPGHGLLADIDRGAGLGQLWRPLSIAPEATRNTLFAELVPLAVLVLGVQLTERELFRLLPVLLIVGAISATIAVGQAVSGADIPLQLYSTSTDRSAVGLFANRNHQGLLLAMMFPMLASVVSMVLPADALRTGRFGRTSTLRAVLVPLLAAASGLCLIPLLLITGSRAGLVLGLAAILTIPLLVLRPTSARSWLGRPLSVEHASDARRPPARRGRALAALVSVAMPVAVAAIVSGAAYLSGRTEAFDRILSSSIADDLRLRALPTTWSMAGHYWPTGSGAGTFQKAYFVAEPDGLLGAVYMNHAHNDWLEPVLTGGFAGLALIVAAVAAFAWRTGQAVSARKRVPADSSKSTQFVWLGLVIILLCALASVSDYPLRAPSLACVFVVAALWADCRLPLQRAAGSVASDGN